MPTRIPFSCIFLNLVSLAGGGGQQSGSRESPSGRRARQHKPDSPERLPAGGHLPGEGLPQDPDSGSEKVRPAPLFSCVAAMARHVKLPVVTLPNKPRRRGRRSRDPGVMSASLLFGRFCVRREAGRSCFSRS